MRKTMRRVCAVETLETRNLMAAGDLDLTFGKGAGYVRSHVVGEDVAAAVVVQRDGTILAAGTAADDFAVAKYRADGQLDTSFGNRGTVRLNLSGVDYVHDMAVQADGKIVVVGAANNKQDFGLMRLHANGRLDTSFGSRSSQPGTVITNLAGTDAAHAVAIQPDGKIVVAGVAGNDLALARYHADGRLDTRFGSRGTLRVNVAGTEELRDVAIQSDGKIVAVGATQNRDDFVLMRVHPDGRLDTTFRGDSRYVPAGFVRTHIAGTDQANAVAIQSDGKIVVAGKTAGDIAVVRYLSSGALDPDFGSDGVARIHVGGEDTGTDLIIQPDGKIVVTGSVNSDQDLVALRLHPGGQLDATFAPGGRYYPAGIKVIHVAGTDRAHAIAMQPDGKVIVAGESSGDFVLVRLQGEPRILPPRNATPSNGGTRGGSTSSSSGSPGGSQGGSISLGSGSSSSRGGSQGGSISLGGGGSQRSGGSFGSRISQPTSHSQLWDQALLEVLGE